MKKTIKFLSLFLALIMVFFCFVGCKKEDADAENKVVVSTAGPPEDNSNGDGLHRQEKLEDRSLTAYITNSDKFEYWQKGTYKMSAPGWKSLGVFINDDKRHISQELDAEHNLINVDYDETYNFYSQGFVSSNSQVYLFVSEYFGNTLYLGDELTYGETPKAVASGLQSYIPEKCCEHYIKKKATASEGSFEPYDASVSGTFKYFELMYTDDSTGNSDYIYSKGYIITSFEYPVAITFIDMSKDRLYSDEIDSLAKQMIDTFSYNANKK